VDLFLALAAENASAGDECLLGRRLMGRKGSDGW
jgi:hypothetical protein